MMEKSFLDRPLCLLCLAAAQEITHAVHSLSRLGELHVKAGSPVSRSTLPPCKQALRGIFCIFTKKTQKWMFFQKYLL